MSYDLPSDAFHNINHELRTVELERVPKGARSALSIGASGGWYFEWFERSVGPLDLHIGIEAYSPEPDDLPGYVSWIANTADRMDDVSDGAVDLVFAGQTSEHLWQHELVGFLIEAHRVLRPGGLLAVDSPNRLVTEYLHWSHGGHTIELSAVEMSTLMRLAGFDPAPATGIWSCVVDGRLLQLEEGLDNVVVLTRRMVEGRDNPDQSFVWWINARRLDIPPDVEALTWRVGELFAQHWAQRVCRGFADRDVSSLQLGTDGGASRQSNLPYPLRQGNHLIRLTLERGSWSQVHGFRLQFVEPNGGVLHVLALPDATIVDRVASWSFQQPWLLFAVVIEVIVDSVDGDVAIALPFDFERWDSPD